MRNLKIKILIFLLFTSFVVIAKEHRVSVKGDDKNNGSFGKPFKTINFAAQIVQPGDIVTVHAGIYREWINPKRGGTSDVNRIVFRVAAGEKVEIKCSEVISGWKKRER